MRDDQKVPLKVFPHSRRVVTADGKLSKLKVVDWTCPQCGATNERQWWFGDDFHMCFNCEEWHPLTSN